MIKTPNHYPADAPPCDPGLPLAALQYRKQQSPPLTTPDFLGAINVTAWLYQDAAGVKRIQVNPNTTLGEINELVRQNRLKPADTPDAEVGIHSEWKAGEWFRARPQFRVLQIFSERIPCTKHCAPLLRNYFPGIPWYYYYDRKKWFDAAGKLLRRPGDILKTVYGL